MIDDNVFFGWWFMMVYADDADDAVDDNDDYDNGEEDA